MSEIIPKLISFFLSVILPIIIGYTLKELFKISKEKLDYLIFINIFFVLPLSMILVFWNMELSAELLYLPILGFILPLISGAIGFFMCGNRFDNLKQKGSYIVASLLSNRGTIGGLTMYILYGEIGLAYVNLIILFGSITVYLIAHPIGNYYGNYEHRKETRQKFSLKSLILRKTNLPILGMIIGLSLNIFVGNRPQSLAVAIDPMIKTMAWLSLIPIGSSIDFHGVKKHLLKTLDLNLQKFVIMPIITALICLPLIHDPLQTTALISTSMTPIAINSVIVAKLNNLDEHVVISAFLSSLLIYLLIIFPILCIVFV